MMVPGRYGPSLEYRGHGEVSPLGPTKPALRNGRILGCESLLTAEWVQL